MASRLQPFLKTDPNNAGKSPGYEPPGFWSSVGSGLKQGAENIRSSVGLSAGPKAGFGIKTEAFGGKASLINISVGQTTTNYGDGSGQMSFNYQADIFKLSYKNAAFGVGGGYEFGVNKDTNQRLSPFDNSTSVFGYDFQHESLSANHKTVGFTVTLGVVELGVNVDLKKFFGFGP